MFHSHLQLLQGRAETSRISDSSNLSSLDQQKFGLLQLYLTMIEHFLQHNCSKIEEDYNKFWKLEKRVKAKKDAFVLLICAKVEMLHLQVLFRFSNGDLHGNYVSAIIYRKSALQKLLQDDRCHQLAASVLADFELYNAQCNFLITFPRATLKHLEESRKLYDRCWPDDAERVNDPLLRKALCSLLARHFLPTGRDTQKHCDEFTIFGSEKASLYIKNACSLFTSWRRGEVVLEYWSVKRLFDELLTFNLNFDGSIIQAENLRKEAEKLVSFGYILVNGFG